MRTALLIGLATASLGLAPLLTPAYGQADKKTSHVAEDVMDHRTMAEAHRKAADCLEAGKPEKECRAQLVKDCKGVAIGRHCGMKDRHKH